MHGRYVDVEVDVQPIECLRNILMRLRFQHVERFVG